MQKEKKTVYINQWWSVVCLKYLDKWTGYLTISQCSDILMENDLPPVIFHLCIACWYWVAFLCTRIIMRRNNFIEPNRSNTFTSLYLPFFFGFGDPPGRQQEVWLIDTLSSHYQTQSIGQKPKITILGCSIWRECWRLWHSHANDTNNYSFAHSK